MHYLHEGAETHQPAASCSAVGFAQMKRNEKCLRVLSQTSQLLLLYLVFLR